MTVGERIRYCRSSWREITQDKLAKLSGLHPVSIRKYETNKMQPQPAQLERIATALGVSYNALAGFYNLPIVMETEGDLMGLFLMLLNSGILEITGERQEDGKIITETASIRVSPNIAPYLKFKLPSKEPNETDPPLDGAFVLKPYTMMEQLLIWEQTVHTYQTTQKEQEANPTRNREFVLQGIQQIKEQFEIILQSSPKYLNPPEGTAPAKPVPDYPPVLEFPTGPDDPKPEE